MAARQATKTALRQVKPILSVDRSEAKKRALNLYKAWYRQIPYIVTDYDIPKTADQCREKLREEFLKNSHVTDIRVIDMLVIKGQMELKETVEIWKQKGHIMTYFKDSLEPKSTDFLSKFFTGQN
ncbi:NADH dehydrogenase (ubiquinone) B14 subunit [Carabus blaptoides fortunei]